jgi:quaternary ammonium compound-resistance protein SugE
LVPAYAVWTGIGAVGTVLVGIVVFKEPATFGEFSF